MQKFSLEVTNHPIFISLSSETKSTKVWLCKVTCPFSGDLQNPHQTQWVILKDCWMEANLTSDIDIHRLLVEQKPLPFADKEEEAIFGEQDRFGIYRDGHQQVAHWNFEKNLPGIPKILMSEKVSCVNLSPSDQRGSKQWKTLDSMDRILRQFTIQLVR